MRKKLITFGELAALLIVVAVTIILAYLERWPDFIVMLFVVMSMAYITASMVRERLEGKQGDLWTSWRKFFRKVTGGRFETQLSPEDVSSARGDAKQPKESP